MLYIILLAREGTESAAKAEKEVTEKLLAEESAKLAKTVAEHQAVLVRLQFKL